MPHRTVVLSPLQHCVLGSLSQKSLWHGTTGRLVRVPCGCDASATTTCKRRHWRCGWTLIRFAEPTAVATITDKRSLLLLASNRMQTPEICICASARGPKVGLHWSGPRANDGPCLSPSSCQTQTSATRRQTTRANRTLLVRGAALGRRPVGIPCTAPHLVVHTTPASLAPLSILSPKPIRSRLAVAQTAQAIDLVRLGLGMQLRLRVLRK